MIDVLWVDYDSRKKWATVRGKCEPSVLVKCIKKMGKAADVVSYSKDPTASSTGDDKSCHAKGKQKAPSASCDSNDDDDDVEESVKDDFDPSQDKNQHHYMHDGYAAPPPKVDESVCRDEFCPIHRRSSANVAAAGMNNGSAFWNHRMGAFRGAPQSPASYGQFGMPPPQHGYGYPPPPPAGYGFCPDQGESTANFFRDQNPAGGCKTM
nr:heavy metal-associated isoprenylated plant protein 35-like [Ipomoea batatas]